MTRKLISLLAITLTCLVLIGCTNTTTETTITETTVSTETTTLGTLSTPENLTSNNNIITWDAVANATNYLVYIGEDMFMTNDTEYTISVEGSYNIYIIAYADGYNNSEPSSTISVTLEFEHQVDFTVTIEDNTISWLAIDDSISYNVNINGTNYNTIELSYSLDEFDPGMLVVSVQALFPIGDSNFCNHIYFEYDLTDNDLIKVNYSINSTKDILIFDIDYSTYTYVTNEDGFILTLNEVVSSDDSYLTLQSDFVKSLNIGINHIFIVQGEYKTEIEINLTEKTDPYIITGTGIYTDGSVDIKFQLELFGGELYSVNGAAEDTVLYDFSQAVITIHKEFIAEKFLTEELFVLSFAINKDDTSVVGYMFFHLEE